ncbi:MAG TPA: hypothetical protein P5291_04550, partial [Flavobacteriales bacterium]|nr:hypothetical protein [Flavobacteriales bacterium]
MQAAYLCGIDRGTDAADSGREISILEVLNKRYEILVVAEAEPRPETARPDPSGLKTGRRLKGRRDR